MDEDEYFALLQRIIKGSEFISSIDESDNRWREAHERYDTLCNQALVWRLTHARK